MPYVWNGSGSLRRPDEFVEPGETFEPTDAELSAFGDLMEAVEPETDESAESGPSADATDDTADGSDDAETYTCAGTTADDEPCTREVDEPGGYCYQHGD